MSCCRQQLAASSGFNILGILNAEHYVVPGRSTLNSVHSFGPTIPTDMPRLPALEARPVLHVNFGLGAISHKVVTTTIKALLGGSVRRGLVRRPLSRRCPSGTLAAWLPRTAIGGTPAGLSLPWLTPSLVKGIDLLRGHHSKNLGKELGNVVFTGIIGRAGHIVLAVMP